MPPFDNEIRLKVVVDMDEATRLITNLATAAGGLAVRLDRLEERARRLNEALAREETGGKRPRGKPQGTNE